VEDFFKMEYGLSTSSAGPAAKLFVDLMREFGGARPAKPAEATAGAGHASVRTSSPAAETPRSPEPPALAAVPGPAPSHDVRMAALEAIKGSLKIDINADWDEDRIRLVFDRMERLMRVIVGGSSEGPGSSQE
jgi:hypothetical protein